MKSFVVVFLSFSLLASSASALGQGMGKEINRGQVKSTMNKVQKLDDDKVSDGKLADDEAIEKTREDKDSVLEKELKQEVKKTVRKAVR